MNNYDEKIVNALIETECIEDVSDIYFLCGAKWGCDEVRTHQKVFIVGSNDSIEDYIIRNLCSPSTILHLPADFICRETGLPTEILNDNVLKSIVLSDEVALGICNACNIDYLDILYEAMRLGLLYSDELKRSSNGLCILEEY